MNDIYSEHPYSVKSARAKEAEIEEVKEELNERLKDVLEADAGELDGAIERWKQVKVRLARMEKELEMYEARKLRFNKKDLVNWARKGV